jgi:hypothetical protein
LPAGLVLFSYLEMVSLFFFALLLLLDPFFSPCQQTKDPFLGGRREKQDEKQTHMMMMIYDNPERDRSFIHLIMIHDQGVQ